MQVAYCLPLLQELSYSNQNNPRILILVPTRELVTQVVETIKELTKAIYERIRHDERVAECEELKKKEEGNNKLIAELRNTLNVLFSLYLACNCLIFCVFICEVVK